MFRAVQIFTFSLALGAMLVGCRIKAPTLEEQQALSEQGAFGTGTPNWVARSTAGSSRSSGGFLSISAPEGVIPPTRVVDSRDRLSIAKTRSEKKTLSPFEQLAEDCPGIESDVNDALTTMDVIERVSKYEMLISKCRDNEQLLLWLAEDYILLNDFSEGRRTVNKILTLNSDSQQARELLRQIQEAR